ncbi:MAG: DUF3135 domain-containing protein [Rhodocyclales bacterium]|nr:DUF3135 domain-containing protein [Rhodocyclales bacterium]
MAKSFEFQEWMALARTAPDDFERQRKELIQAFLDESNDEQRQLGMRLQREIDHEIRRAGNPQQALVAISKMMWSQLDFLCEELEALSHSMRELDRVASAGAARLALALQPAAPLNTPRGA